MFGGLSLLLVGVNLSLSLLPPLPADAQVAGILLGGTQVPVATVILFDVIFLVAGIELSLLGAIVALFGAGRGRVQRVKHTKARR